MAILSNLATESLVTATCRLNTRFLSRNKAEPIILLKKWNWLANWPRSTLTEQLPIIREFSMVSTPSYRDWQ